MPHGFLRRGRMRELYRAMTRVERRTFDGGELNMPAGDLSLTECEFRVVSWEGRVTPVFFARGCFFEHCDFREARFERGYFGGGEGAAYRQTLYRDCNFENSVFEEMSFGSARFERCAFRDVKMRRWHSFSAEFVDCVFAGEIGDAAFLGHSPLPFAARSRNEFRDNDFAQARFGSVEFRGGIDLRLQRMPPEGVVLDRRAERIRRALIEIGTWPDVDARDQAARFLEVYSGSRYDGQEQLYLHSRPAAGIDDELQKRVIEILMKAV